MKTAKIIKIFQKIGKYEVCELRTNYEKREKSQQNLWHDNLCFSDWI